MLTSICLPSSSSNAHGDEKKSRIKVARRHEAAYDVEKYKTLRSSFGTGRVDSFTIESVEEKSSFFSKNVSRLFIPSTSSVAALQYLFQSGAYMLEEPK